MHLLLKAAHARIYTLKFGPQHVKGFPYLLYNMVDNGGEKRPLYKQRQDKAILLHDNAQPHVAKPVKTYLETLQWEVLPHPPYSPDIAPSDFYLFCSMAHGLADQRFHSYEEAKKWIYSWIASKEMSFFRHGILILTERWEKVVASDGQFE
ncbi:Mariner Mos1 transposase [Eumeta japonica]|uniref:Mariner Mos1 transposase n=1 Tax=Eumeta variegata TaxID=151549 RepID=A0A4C1VND6_EUMVA|nr:Mariner Mos1 transposase [Eumeta japonica]